MSRPRIHEYLVKLFESKDKEIINSLINHPDYQDLTLSLNSKISPEKLSRAFIHSSFSHEFNIKNQEVLEFLGDAVLQLIVTEKLVNLYPDLPEGKLSKMRSFLVNESSLARLARFMNFENYIILGKGEFAKKTYLQDAVLADTFEAVLAVLFKVDGLEFCRGFVLKLFLATDPNAFEMTNLESYDAKSKLQEYSLKNFKKLPVYKSTEEGEGFLVELFLNEELVNSGVFRSKKLGEKTLAQQYLQNLN